MRYRMLPLLVLAVLASAACELNRTGVVMSEPEYEPLRLAVPDLTYRLAPEDRAKVSPMFDADALERLLGMVKPDARKELLIMFQLREKSDPQGVITDLYDPHLQAVLEEVWAPHWEAYSDEQLEKENAPIPGRELAIRRRAERRRGEGGASRPE